MISEIQMAYGSRMRRQGSSRACRRNQLNNGRTNDLVFGPRAGCLSLFAWAYLDTAPSDCARRVERRSPTRRLRLCSPKGAGPEAGVPGAVSRCAFFAMGSRCTVAESTTTPYDDSTFMKPLTSYTCTLGEPEAAALEKHLREHSYEFRDVPYARFAAQKEKVNVVFYQSGKLVVQGKGTQDFVEFVLEPGILKQARLGYETVLNPDLLLPRLGVDESGKGDFFGPLCIAGAYVNEGVVKAWENAGIRDSKNIGSDKKVAELARLIGETAGCVTSVVPIGNEAYNRLYRQMKSVNAILAWGHARVIENLMGQKHRMIPSPVRAISDQFAANKDTVANALMSLGRGIELVQRHKADADLAGQAAQS